MDENDRSAYVNVADISLTDWLRIGRRFFSIDELQSFLAMAEKKLADERERITQKEAAVRSERGDLQMTLDERNEAKKCTFSMTQVDAAIRRTDIPIGSIPAPDEALSVPKIILYVLKQRASGGARAAELLTFVRKHRPNKARTSVYSALHQLCETKHIHKEGGLRNFVYFLGPAKGGGR